VTVATTSIVPINALKEAETKAKEAAQRAADQQARDAEIEATRKGAWFTPKEGWPPGDGPFLQRRRAADRGRRRRCRAAAGDSGKADGAGRLRSAINGSDPVISGPARLSRRSERLERPCATSTGSSSPRPWPTWLLVAFALWVGLGN
jgi:hypothetical protein